MKFRMLHREELESLKDQFINFLVVQGIDVQTWQYIKTKDTAKAEKIVEVFSDFVWDDVLSKIKYMDHFSGRSLQLFQCEEDTIHLVNLECKTTMENIEDFIHQITSDPSSCSIQKASKIYIPDRNTELFRMYESGAQINNGELFHIFNK